MVTQQEELITVRQAAREAGRTAETVRRWIWEGKLPAEKLGNQLFLKKAVLDRWLSKGRAQNLADRLAVLEDIRVLREKIARRIGGNLDVLAMLDESRSSH